MRENLLIELAAEDRHRGTCCVSKFCRACGAHVSGYNANALLTDQRPEAREWDWWMACDNAECDNSYGEGVFQVLPDWVEQRRADQSLETWR